MFENKKTEALEALRETLVWMLGEVTLELESRKIAYNRATESIPKEKRTNRPSLTRQLKEYQREHNLSVNQLAQRMKVSGSSISAWYRGKWNPSVKIRAKIKALLSNIEVE